MNRIESDYLIGELKELNKTLKELLKVLKDSVKVKKVNKSE